MSRCARMRRLRCTRRLRSKPAPRPTGRTSRSPSAASSIRRVHPTFAKTRRSTRGGSAVTRWRDGRCRAERFWGPARASTTGMAPARRRRRRGSTRRSAWAGFDVIGGTGLFRQFPGFNAIVGLRGTPGLPAERAWHADIGVGRRFGPHLRAQAVWFHRVERDGLRLPGDEWQLVDGRPRPPLADTAYDARLDGTRAASSCSSSAAARTGSRAGRATRWAVTGNTTS